MLSHNLSAEGRSRKRILGELAASEKEETCAMSVRRMDKKTTSLDHECLLDLNKMLN